MIGWFFRMGVGWHSSQVLLQWLLLQRPCWDWVGEFIFVIIELENYWLESETFPVQSLRMSMSCKYHLRVSPASIPCEYHLRVSPANMSSWFLLLRNKLPALELCRIAKRSTKLTRLHPPLNWDLWLLDAFLNKELWFDMIRIWKSYFTWIN